MNNNFDFMKGNGIAGGWLLEEMRRSRITFIKVESYFHILDDYDYDYDYDDDDDDDDDDDADNQVLCVLLLLALVVVHTVLRGGGFN